MWFNTVINKYRTTLEQKKGQLKQLESQAMDSRKKLRILNRELKHTEEAQAIIQKVAQMTQEELEYHISDIVSLALAAVFDDPYELKLDFVIRRGKTEADLWLVRNGERAEPLSATGGGAVDVAAFALRVALWSLSKPRSRSVLILDEPFRFLSTDLISRASNMLKQISQRLGLQIIMVSHSEEIIEQADRIFRVKIKKGKSEVIEL